MAGERGNIKMKNKIRLFRTYLFTLIYIKVPKEFHFGTIQNSTVSIAIIVQWKDMGRTTPISSL